MATDNLRESANNGQDSILNAALQRSGNIAANIGKAAAEQAARRADNKEENALAALGIAGANSIITALNGEDQNTIPPQYTGGAVDTEVQHKDYMDTYKFANEFLFNTTQVTRNYGANPTHPMTKSLFLVDFEFNTDILPTENRLKNAYPKSMSFLMRNMTMPRADIETEVLNSYNKHVIMPKKINYSPVTCQFGDIYKTYKDGENKISILDLFKQYMSYYFNDFVHSGNPDLHHGFASGRTHKQYINNIHIYFFWADGARKITLHNPFIKSFAYDSLDYNADDQLTVSCDIEYEYIDMSELTLTYDDFVDGASKLLETVTNNLKTNTISNPYQNYELLTPSESPEDTQRNVNLDNPVAQTLLRLGEIGLVDFQGDALNSENPLERTVAESTVNASLDIGASIGSSINNNLDGLL